MASSQLQNALCLFFSAFSTHIFDYPTLDGYVTKKVLRFTTHVGIYSGLIGICLPPPEKHSYLNKYAFYHVNAKRNETETRVLISLHKSMEIPLNKTCINI